MRKMGAALTLVLLAACGGSEGGEEGPLIVATTSILGDVVANLVDENVRVETIMPVGADPHDFEPSAQLAALIRRADLVIANGLGLEEGLIDVIAAAEAEGTNVLQVAPLVGPIPFSGEHAHEEEEDHAEEDEEENGETGDDPHFWQDPIRMMEAVELIAARMLELGFEGVTERAAVYAEEILDTHEANEELLSGIDPERRKLVTNHEALGYFADRYGFDLIAVVVPGGSTLAEPSAGDLAELVDEMRAEGVDAIFAENTNPTVLADAVAAELGSDVAVVQLYTDSLGEPGSIADSYLGMISENARLVAGALR